MKPASTAGEAWANLCEWSSSLRTLLVVVGLFAIGLGVPVGVLAHGQSVPSGLVIGALTGVAFFGLVALALLVILGVGLLVDLTVSVLRRR